MTTASVLQSGPRCLALLTISTKTIGIGATGVRLSHPQCDGFETLYIGMTWCKVSRIPLRQCNLPFWHKLLTSDMRKCHTSFGFAGDNTVALGSGLPACNRSTASGTERKIKKETAEGAVGLLPNLSHCWLRIPNINSNRKWWLVELKHGPETGVSARDCSPKHVHQNPGDSFSRATGNLCHETSQVLQMQPPPVLPEHGHRQVLPTPVRWRSQG